MMCLRALRCAKLHVRCGVISKSYSNSSSKRPTAAKTHNERIIERSKELAEVAPTSTRVKIYWTTTSNFKKMILTSAIGIICYIYIKVVYNAYKTDKLHKENERKTRTYGELAVGGPFELVDTNGNVVSTETLKGDWVLLYFGFTYCPDICPEQMQMMSDVVDIVKEEHNIDVIPLMITIDLERDTPEVLAEYVAEYSPKIIGLRGTEQQIDDVCNAYRCYRSKGQAYDDPNDYILDHTVTQYLINPDGKTVGYFMSNRVLEERVPILLEHVRKYIEFKNSVAEEASETPWINTIKKLVGLDATPL